MSRNRIKSDNNLPIRKIILGVAVCIGVTSYGLLFVFGRLQSDALAKENKKLELTLGELEAKNRRLMLERQKLITPESLERRLAYFRIELVPLNRLQVLDAQSFHNAGASVLARGPRLNGGGAP